MPGTADRFSTSEVRSALRYIVLAWFFGAAFFAVTGGAAYASFLKQYLKLDDQTYGLIMACGPATTVFLLLGSYHVERTGRCKGPFLWWVTFHRLLWLALAAVPWLWRVAGLRVAVTLVVLVAFVSSAAANFGGVGFYTWMATIIPKPISGRYFGFRARVGLVSMMLAGLGVSLLLDRYRGQGWMYSVVFGGAALLGALDILLFIPVRELPRAAHIEAAGLAELLKTPWREPRFTSFQAYSAVAFMAYAMMGPFVFPFCFASPEKQGLGLSLFKTTVVVVLVPQLMMAWVAPAWGKTIDVFGPKSALRASSLAAIALAGVWLVIHRGGPFGLDLVWLVPLTTMVTGLTWPGIDQVNQYVQIQEWPDLRRSAYTASMQVTIGLAAVVGTALGGVLAHRWEVWLPLLPWRPAWLSHYHMVFATSMLLRVVAFKGLFSQLPLTGRDGCWAVYEMVFQELLATLPGRRRQGS